ncbi:MAG: hypothetical protein HC898_00015 [Phycisphaerales bacterium]|nr:hypothetical protein [Phycisphaerales bacterium]
MFHRVTALAFCLSLLMVTLADAQPIIHGPSSATGLGNYNLLPDKPGQTISILVKGGQAVQGLNFNIQIADGGPAAGGSILGPSITAVDILTGTIFAANNTGNPQGNGILVPQVAFYSTTTASGSVAAQGLLASVTLDTTGFFAGTFDLILSNTINSSTNFASMNPALSPTIIDGSITLVPEPMSLMIVIGAGLMMQGRRSRRMN